jgi:uracil-DNA glycosylase family 4
MAVKYSQGLLPIDPCRNKRCKACGLYLNQFPILSPGTKSEVFWVGLSAVLFNEYEEKRPLASNTASGALIKQIEEPFLNGISFYKTNIVKCVPMNSDKIRYPFEHEMEKCFPNFENEIESLSPACIFLLGKQVAAFVLKKLAITNISLNENFNYEWFEFNNINFIPIHHPSYILVYKRKLVSSYITKIQTLFSDLLLSNHKTA